MNNTELILEETKNLCKIHKIDLKYSYNDILMGWQFNLEKQDKRLGFIISDYEIYNKPFMLILTIIKHNIFKLLDDYKRI